MEGASETISSWGEYKGKAFVSERQAKKRWGEGCGATESERNLLFFWTLPFLLSPFILVLLPRTIRAYFQGGGG